MALEMMAMEENDNDKQHHLSYDHDTIVHNITVQNGSKVTHHNFGIMKAPSYNYQPNGLESIPSSMPYMNVPNASGNFDQYKSNDAHHQSNNSSSDTNDEKASHESINEETLRFKPTTDTEDYHDDNDNETDASQHDAVVDRIMANKQRSVFDDIREHKMGRFCTDFLFWIRILVLILTIFLLVLSSSYCIAQLLEAKLVLITPCPEPKTSEEIWQHSYEATRKYPANDTINEETYYGFTDEPCWTTKTSEINSTGLWYSNTFASEYTGDINAQCILFGIAAFYCVIIILYIIFNLIGDIVSVNRGTLHKKSKLYPPYIKQQQNAGVTAVHVTDLKRSKNGKCKGCKCKSCQEKIGKLIAWNQKFYFRYFAQDTTGWVILKFINEISELLLQSNALLIYNGYDIFNANVYQANKPEFIQLFAGIIAFNSFGSGLLWLLYATVPNFCYGLIFKRCLFFIDKFSDLLYIIFPFIMLYYDDYNANTGNFTVLLAQLNIESGLAFIAVYFPLFLACSKCLMIAITTAYNQRKNYFEDWKMNQEDTNKTNFSPLETNDPSTQQNQKKDWDQSWIRKSTDIEDKNPKIKKCLKASSIICLAVMFIGFGVFVIIYVFTFISDAKETCSSVAESNYIFPNNTVTKDQLLEDHPELYLWDKCLYKVYPFPSPNTDDIPCQCRVFVIEEWSGLSSTYQDRAEYLNITQQSIIDGALSNWKLLEKFKSTGNEAPTYITYELGPASFASSFMKAFEWTYSRLTSISDGISNWEKLEYMKLEQTFILDKLPSDLGGLTNLKDLFLIDVGLQAFPVSICNLTNLDILEITREFNIHSVPKCIVNLKALRIFGIDSAVVTDIPLGIFALPNLLEFSLHDGFVGIEELLYYNLPDDIDQNDTAEVEEWFNGNFKYNEDTIYWLQLNPMCSIVPNKTNILWPHINSTSEYWIEYNGSVPVSFKDFLLSDNTQCQKLCDPQREPTYTRFCTGRSYSDGHCDIHACLSVVSLYRILVNLCVSCVFSLYTV